MYVRPYKHEPSVLLEALQTIPLDHTDPEFERRVSLVTEVLRHEKSSHQAAEESGVSQRSIQGWVRKVDEEGWDALRPAPALGRPNRLTEEERAEVKQVVLDDPGQKGYSKWSGSTIADYIRKTYHIEYGRVAAVKLAGRLGVSHRLDAKINAERRKTEIGDKAAVDIQPDGSSSEDIPEDQDIFSDVPAGEPQKACTGRTFIRKYTSEISLEQFNLIKPLLESVVDINADRTYSLYDIFCGISYILTTGAQWRNMPVDLPPYQIVYHYFQLWTKPNDDGVSILAKCMAFLRSLFRNNFSKKDKLTLAIVDAKSIKNVDTAKKKGYDAGKKVSGIKLHMLVDTLGLPHAIWVTTANVTDRDGAIEMISHNLSFLSDVEKILVDGGYSGKSFADKVHQLLPNTTVEVVKRTEQHTFRVLPKRWIVERSFGWLEKYRRLWKNCERDLNTALQMTILAFIILLLKRF